MPRKLHAYSHTTPYHVTARVNNRENFPGNLDYVWKALTGELYLQTKLYRIAVHAFVLMPNHFHLLVTTPETSISKSMGEFLSSSTRIINTRCRRSGRMYGDRYHWSLIQEPLYYAHALKYVYRNPVKAGLCERAGEYPFSTYAGLIGTVGLPVSLTAPLGGLDHLVPEGFQDLDQWLDEPYRHEETSLIKRALRKRTFAFPVDRKLRKPQSVAL